jgi:hypothetical protein
MTQPKSPKSWRRVLWVAFVAAVLGTFAWMVLRPKEPEPVYQGRPVSYWLSEYYRKGGAAFMDSKYPDPARDPEMSNGPIAALKQIGTNAIPNYLRLAKSHISKTQRTLLLSSWLKYYPRWLLSYLNDIEIASVESPRKARLGFMLLGSNGVSAVPDLIHLLKTSDNQTSRRTAATALGYVGLNAKDALPVLVQTIADHDEFVRVSAFRAIQEIGKDRSTREWHSDCVSVILPELKKLSDDPRCDHWLLVQLLEDLRFDVRLALPVLQPLLNDTNVEIALRARELLKLNDPEAAGENKLK